MQSHAQAKGEFHQFSIYLYFHLLYPLPREGGHLGLKVNPEKRRESTAEIQAGPEPVLDLDVCALATSSRLWLSGPPGVRSSTSQRLEFTRSE